MADAASIITPLNVSSYSVFTPQQIDVLLPLADDALMISLGNTRDEHLNHYGQKWIKTNDRPDLNLIVSQSTVPGNNLVCHKAVCLLKDISPDKAMSFFVDDIPRRLAWDKGR